MIQIKTYPNSSGFIALISAIIISSILVGLLLTSSGAGLSTRINMLDRELKRDSEYLAQSCINVTLLKISQNYTYTPAAGGDRIVVGTDMCTIQSVAYTTENSTTHTKTATIQVQAAYRSTWTTLRVTATVRSPSWAHDPTLGDIRVLSSQEI